MIKRFQLFVFALLIPLFFSGLNVAKASDKAEKITIDWKAPVSPEIDIGTFIPSLLFSGAIYSDTLPQVPVFFLRKSLPLSQYNYEFRTENHITEVCSDAEIKILKESGFSNTDFFSITYRETTAGYFYSVFHLVPVRYHNGVYEKLVSFDLVYNLQFLAEEKSAVLNLYPESSVLSTGNWYRLCVEQDGIYRLTRQDLVELGINPAQINKSTIQLFGNGGGMLAESNVMPRITDLLENSIWVSGTGNTFANDDFILFYGQSPNKWRYNAVNDIFEHEIHLYSSETCYFLTHGREQGKRVQQGVTPVQTPTQTVTDFYDYRHHERELNNLLGSGKQWFGELFDVTTSRTFEFNFPNIVSETAKISVNAAARSSSASSFTIESMGVSQSFNAAGVNMAISTGIFARSVDARISGIPQGDNLSVRITYNRQATGSRGWLNFVTINARRQLIKTGEQMFFRNPSVAGPGKIARFEVRGLTGNNTVWDITDPFNITSPSVQLAGQTGTFTVNSNQLRQFVVFGDQSYPRPRLRGAVPNQNLHGLEVHDMIVIVPEIFRAEAQRLADFRLQFDGISVALVSPQQVYNEFSSGTPDIVAIRNFMKMFYDRRQFKGSFPRYLLLFGNGTYDNKNLLGFGGNLIPTFQTQQSLNPSSSYISDDFFGLLDQNEGFDAAGAIDLGIGRLPVRTLDEARFVVNKILRYNQRIEGLVPGSDDPRFAGVIPNYADWRNVIAIIADDEDGNVHLEQTEQVANYLSSTHPVFNLEKIYLDAYEQTTLAGGARYPDVNNAINKRVNQGALLINYIGHGGTLGLAHERILTFNDILSWGNFYNLPVFMTATCEFSSFDQPDANELSAGVRIFLKPDGGASALFTTTRLAYSHSNFTLNDAFIRNAFIPMENGEMPRLGDLIRISKVRSSSASTLKNFVLLGDPSMQMAYPKYKAITTQIPDTIKALQRVTVKGEVRTPQGTRATSYNGVIYPTIYDKKGVFSTLANDPGSSKRNFTLQNRIIYRGAASVVNGVFEFTFVVPRDINYSTGNGKISYYFDNQLKTDGNGYYDNFIVSGTAPEFTKDDQGPAIDLYINNLNFKSGGNTGPNPVLIALLGDDSGINTTGQIGHDIVAFLNDDFSNPIILNNFYQSELNSYRSGRVIFPFFNLEKGEYTLTLRAWDAQNNAGTATIDFVVTSAPGLQLNTLKSFPNPFSQSTKFYIEHNKPATELRISIDIFGINGQLYRSIRENVYASGFNIPPIEWDGRDEGGSLLSNGIYFFRVIVSTATGDQVQKTERLMILR